MESSRNPIPEKPLANQDIGYSGCLLVSIGHGLREFKMTRTWSLPSLEASKKVKSTANIWFGREASKCPIGAWTLKRGSFARGAPFVVLTPLFNIFTHPGPKAPLSYQLGGPRWTLTAMVVMELLQHLPLQALWQQELVDLFTTIRPKDPSIQQADLFEQIGPTASARPWYTLVALLVVPDCLNQKGRKAQIVGSASCRIFKSAGVREGSTEMVD